MDIFQPEKRIPLIIGLGILLLILVLFVRHLYLIRNGIIVEHIVDLKLYPCGDYTCMDLKQKKVQGKLVYEMKIRADNRSRTPVLKIYIDRNPSSYMHFEPGVRFTVRDRKYDSVNYYKRPVVFLEKISEPY